MPERLHERLLHDVIGLLPGAEQERGAVRAQRVPGDQHAIRVKVTATGPGYRLRVLDGSPHQTDRSHLNTPAPAARFHQGRGTQAPLEPLAQIGPFCLVRWLLDN